MHTLFGTVNQAGMDWQGWLCTGFLAYCVIQGLAQAAARAAKEAKENPAAANVGLGFLNEVWKWMNK